MTAGRACFLADRPSLAGFCEAAPQPTGSTRGESELGSVRLMVLHHGLPAQIYIAGGRNGSSKAPAEGSAAARRVHWDGRSGSAVYGADYFDSQQVAMMEGDAITLPMRKACGAQRYLQADGAVWSGDGPAESLPGVLVEESGLADRRFHRSRRLASAVNVPGRRYVAARLAMASAATSARLMPDSRFLSGGECFPHG